MDSNAPRCQTQQPASQWLTVLRDYWLLTRPRIVGLVLFAMAVAVWAAGDVVPPWPIAVHALGGTALVIVGAVVLNQRMEREGDARMTRTADRPLPAGRLTARHVARVGMITSVLGFVSLAVLANWWLLALAAVSWLIYVFAYTPLKPITAWQTPVGAVAGAMPVLLGAAVGGWPFGLMAVVLFAVVYFWQFPHAMAIAWLYRDQFDKAHIKVATVTDPSGRAAARLAVGGSMALLTVSLVPSMLDLTGPIYGVTALVLGHGYMACAFGFLHRRTDAAARRLLRVSIVYLLVLFPALLIALAHGEQAERTAASAPTVAGVSGVQ